MPDLQLIRSEFDPIGMTSSTFDMDSAVATENHASPVTFNFQKNVYEAVPIDYERFVTSVAPAGAVWSNADDMARYMLMQLNRGVAPDGTRIVSQENLLETQTTNISTGVGGYGMGWFIDQYHGLAADFTWRQYQRLYVGIHLSAGRQSWRSGSGELLTRQ